MAGLKRHASPKGNPEQLKLTVPVYPPSEVTVTLTAPGLPLGSMVRDVGEQRQL